MVSFFLVHVICDAYLSAAHLASNNEAHTFLIQPEDLRAPEVTIGAGWDTPADIWNLGCLVGIVEFARLVLHAHAYSW